MSNGGITGAEPERGADGVVDPKRTRPRAVSVASVLWMVLGGVFLVGSGQLRYGIGVYAFVVGLAILICGIFLRWGSNVARILVTVLGGVTLLGLFPVLLVVPAVVLQFRRESNAWFEGYAGRSAPPAA